jgi:hypothetical protein
MAQQEQAAIQWLCLLTHTEEYGRLPMSWELVEIEKPGRKQNRMQDNEKLRSRRNENRRDMFLKWQKSHPLKGGHVQEHLWESHKHLREQAVAKLPRQVEGGQRTYLHPPRQGQVDYDPTLLTKDNPGLSLHNN